MKMVDDCNHIIEANEDERIMIDCCNRSASNTHCINCPYRIQCEEFEYIHGTIPYSFKIMF